ncbi:MAG: glycoside hydrolase family 38 C-terminal domain-containing protein [Eubacteriales bacterium]|nr:glycoside hydrolase family 38 C-terminal domain-containing protein [Eubacteriales bacterium]
MKTIYLIGNAHLDPVWLWRWQEGFAEIKATFKSALDRMREFDDFQFTSACALYYEWVEKNEPALFEEIKQRVKEGRWHIVGGWFIQPDCNIPCGESFARHGLISQRYFMDKFGVFAKTGYNVDSFGHHANLPQILKKSGMDNYVYMRPGKHEKDIPSLFKWESTDGSFVNTFRIPLFYNINLERMDTFDKINNMAQNEDIDYMAFYGVGNHGGGATVKLLDAIHEMDREIFVFSNCDEYFDMVADLPMQSIKDDLQFHAKGCYSAHSKIKHDNRLCEHNVLTAEKFAVLSKKLCNTTYPKKKLTKAWKNILFNQFHDILGGCSIKDAYTDAAYLHGEAMSISEQTINFDMQKISWNIDTLGDAKPTGEKDDWKIWENEEIGTPVVVFNPLPWKIKSGIQVNAQAKKIMSEEGENLPIQIIRGKQTNVNDKFDTLFMAEVPALGYATYRMFLKSEKEKDFENPFYTSEYVLENKLVRVSFDKISGEISSYFDKSAGMELLSDTLSAVLMDDTQNDTWAHDRKNFKDRLGEFCGESIKLIENGPVRSVMRTVSKYKNSILYRDYILYADKVEIEVQARVDFFEKHAILKLQFPVNTAKPKALCEIPYGFIERKTDGDEQVCAQWFCVKDEQSNCGLGIANNSKYSFDVEGSTASLTVLRSAIFADHFGERDEFCEFMEQGMQEFSYMLFPHISIEETTKKAYELNVKARHIVETFHKGTLKTQFCGIDISANNIIVSALKQSEDENGFILRLVEIKNKDTKVRINIPLLNTEFETEFSHNEIKTFLIDDKSNVREVNLIEW